MPIVRRRLNSATVYPDDIRYNPSGDKVQRKVNGNWEDAPESDPRNATTFPPRLTSDPACDSARSVAVALQDQIDKIANAIDNTETVFQIAGLILGLFSFGVFTIFINIALAVANYMTDIGTAAIESTLTPTAYQTLTCILSCHMDSQGRVNKGSLPLIFQDIADQIAMPGAQVLIEMLTLAGEGGINNLGAIGTSTGDCDECGCSEDWCYLFDFFGSDGDWARDTAGGDNNGTWVAAQGWNYTDYLNTVPTPDTANRMVYIQRGHASTTITKVTVTYNFTGGTYDTNTLRALIIFLNGIDRGNKIRSAMVNGTSQTFVIEGEWTGIEQISLFLRSSRDISSPYTYSGDARILSVQIEGTGSNPFGTDNC